MEFYLVINLGLTDCKKKKKKKDLFCGWIPICTATKTFNQGFFMWSVTAQNNIK